MDSQVFQRLLIQLHALTTPQKVLLRQALQHQPRRNALAESLPDLTAGLAIDRLGMAARCAALPLQSLSPNL